ncbi:MAG: phospho-N-acetylmuramoyl-pentapeptide-transferase [Planctomycetota bacterium]
MLYWLLEVLNDWLAANELDSFVMVLYQLGFRAFVAGFTAFAAVMICGGPVIRWLRSKKIGDTAQFDVAALNEAMASKANTPTMGGLLIAGAIAGATLLFADLANRYVQLALVVLAWHAAVGGADDWLKLTAASRPGGSRQGLYSWEKFVFQIGCGLLVGYFAFSAGASPTDDPSLAHVLNLPFQKTFMGAQLGQNPNLIFLAMPVYIVIMTLMMAGMSNAVNITDGMDGLASGVTVAVGIGLLVLCFIAGDAGSGAGDVGRAHELLVPYVATSDELTVVTAAMLGAVLGFLWFNCSPASVFMGDTGSLCLGGLLGYMATIIRQEFVVLLMAGVFVIEIVSVILQVGYFKATGGKRIFRCAPYHWHLRMGGWQEQKIVARFWILSALLVAVALASLKLR